MSSSDIAYAKNMRTERIGKMEKNKTDEQNNIKESPLRELEKTTDGCKLCGLHKTRKNIVFGKGTEHPTILFVGEAPGADEDMQGFPFVGRAGKLLDKWLLKYNLSLETVYIMNAVKCRPPENRDPLPEEKSACRKYFDKQIEILCPKIICALGKHAFANLSETYNVNEGYKDVRGKIHDYKGTAVIATYHPAFILRSPNFAGKVYEDFDLLLETLKSKI